MFVNDRIVFVELHKTGGTHIGKWLKRLVGGEQVGKHNRVPPHLRDRFIIGSVRNPWDWYVSLWAYGCAGKGSVHRQTTRGLDLKYVWRQLGPEMGRPGFSLPDAVCQVRADLLKPKNEWRLTYEDASNVAGFRRWLKMMMNPDRRFDMAEGYGFSPVSSWAGLMTYRYLKLFSRLDCALYTDSSMASYEGSKSAWQQSRMVGFIIRNEALEDDLSAALDVSGFPISEQEKQALKTGSSEKTNTSRRKTVDYYYDEETISLVAQREALIIENHGYTPPGSGCLSSF